MIGICLTNICTIGAEAADSVKPTEAAVLENALADPSGVPVTSYQIGEKGSIVIPIQFSRGGEGIIEIDVVTEAKVNGCLFNDASMKGMDGMFMNVGQGVFQLRAYPETARTQYLFLYPVSEDEGKKIDLRIRAYQYVKAAGGELKAGQWAAEYGFSQEPVYYKLQVPSEGYIKIEASIGNPSVVLYNHRKKPIEKKEFGTCWIGESDGSGYYGVKKGAYYLKLKCSGVYRVRYTFTPLKSKNNTKVKKAITLKRGKKAKGCILYGKKKEYWYKVQLKKPGKLKFSLEEKSNDNGYGAFYFAIFQKGKGRTLEYVTLENFVKGSKKSRRTFHSKKLKAGTYYIKVYNFSGHESGAYSIKLK